LAGEVENETVELKRQKAQLKKEPLVPGIAQGYPQRSS
jgi:hypothetical protein